MINHKIILQLIINHPALTVHLILKNTRIDECILNIKYFLLRILSFHFKMWCYDSYRPGVVTQFMHYIYLISQFYNLVKYLMQEWLYKDIISWKYRWWKMLIIFILINPRNHTFSKCITFVGNCAKKNWWLIKQLMTLFHLCRCAWCATYSPDLDILRPPYV